MVTKFPNLREMRKEIQEALAAEERKYRLTLKRGQELTQKDRERIQGKRTE